MTTYVSTATSVVMPSVRLLGLQLLDLVPEPVKAVILLFPARGKLEELTNREEEEMKEKGATPVDPTVFLDQTDRTSRWRYPTIESGHRKVRSATHAARLAFYMH